MVEQSQQVRSEPIAVTVAQAWASVLGRDDIAADRGFFELGGHSLTALRVIYTLRRELQIQLSLRDLMEAGTLAEFTDTVARAATEPASGRPAVPLVGRRGTR